MQSIKELFFRHMGIPSPKPVGLQVERAKGIYLYDETGKEYIDLISGVSVSNVGHCHPRVIEAIKNQSDKYLHLMVYGEYIQSPQVLLAKELTDLMPQSLNSVYFVNSGSEAIEGALKLAKRFTGRTQIIAFLNAYHGGTHGALSILGNEFLKNAFRPLLPDIDFIRFNHFEDLERITERTACVIIESVQAEAGVILPVAGYLQQVRHRCNQTGTLLILDDIQMGFGRTGKMFSFETFDFIPDILTLAKGMGGGMPVGAFISSDKIMKTISYDPELGHITTFGGHPVSCAAALANLKVLTRANLIENVGMKGEMFKSALRYNLQIREIRQTGLMLGIDLENENAAIRSMEMLFENGILSDRFLFRPQAFRIAPPLNITNEEIEKAVNLILKSLS